MFSEKARLVNRATKVDLGSRFLAEAKQHLDLEAGKGSITTVQGLYILFLVSCFDGTNRAGAMYRLAALDMLSKMRPEKMLAKLSDQTPDTETHRALAKLNWGVFNFEW